jgi:hypothetical protein
MTMWLNILQFALAIVCTYLACVEHGEKHYRWAALFLLLAGALLVASGAVVLR